MKKLSDLMVLRRAFGNYTLVEVAEAVEVLETPYEKESMRRYMSLRENVGSIRQDVMNGTYMGKTGEDMELYRQKIVREIMEEEDIGKALDILMEGAEEIREHCVAINYNAVYKEACRIQFLLDTVKGMVRSEVALEKVQQYMSAFDKEEVAKVYEILKQGMES